MIFPDDITLIELINSFPGVVNTHEYITNTSYNLWFNIGKTDEGLFLLTRCTDKRYCRYGDLWNIKICAGDTCIGDIRPVSYNLSIDLDNLSFLTIEMVIADLIDNIKHHLNHQNFLKIFNINSEQIFNNYITNDRKRKIELIKLRTAIKNTKFPIINREWIK